MKRFECGSNRVCSCSFRVRVSLRRPLLWIASLLRQARLHLRLQRACTRRDSQGQSGRDRREGCQDLTNFDSKELLETAKDNDNRAPNPQTDALLHRALRTFKSSRIKRWTSLPPSAIMTLTHWCRQVLHPVTTWSTSLQRIEPLF